MTRFAVIADDFTGAGDSGVHFAAAGFRSALALNRSGLQEGFADHDVIAFSTESRFLAPGAAAAVVAEAARLCRKAGAEIFYKKIDSTIRGNIAAEIRGLLGECGCAAALVCPAMPKTGRVVRDGKLLLNGTPVSETEIGRDPFTPVPSSAVGDLFFGWQWRNLSIGVVREGADAVTGAVREMLAEGCGAIIADAETDADLQTLGQALRNLSPDVLPAGAGGLAEAFVMGNGGGAPCAEPSGRLLAVVGSLTTASREQIDHALASGRFAAVDVDSERGLNEPDSEIRRTLEIADAVPADKHLLLKNARTPSKCDTSGGGASGISRENGLRVAELFGRVAAEIARRADCRRLYATGGSTAVAVAAAAGISLVTLERECAPGVVLGSCRSGTPVRWFITKAGGFGGPDTITKLV